LDPRVAVADTGGLRHDARVSRTAVRWPHQIALSLAFLIALLPISVGAQTQATKRVLLLHQSGGTGTFRGLFDVAFVDAIRSGHPASIDLYEESIETTRFPGSEQSRIVKDYLKQKYADRQIDVLVAQGIDPFTFARENRALFGNPPIVTIVAPAGRLTSNDNVTGLQGGYWIGGTIDLALALLPETKWIYVVDGARENSNHLQGEFERQLHARQPGLGLVYLRDLPLSDVQSRIAAVPRQSAVLFVRQTMRSRSQDVDQWEALDLIVRASPVPVFSHIEQYLGHGILGGSIWRFESDARRLAGMAKRIASGTPAAEIPPERATYSTMIDWRQLQRWGIPESRVPAGSIIVSRTQTFMGQYGGYVLAGVVLFLAQTALILTLWIQRARRRESERRNSAILRAAPDLMFLQDRDGVYLDYHAPNRDCLFVPPEQFIGHNMRDLLSPHVLEHVNPLFEQVWKTDQTVIGEYDLEVMGGRRRYEARLVRCGEDKVVSVVRDITERASAQAALMESEHRYAMATAAGGAGVWDWNLETDDLYVDPRLKALLGFDDDEIPDRFDDWCRCVHPADLEMVLSRVRAHVDGRTPSFDAEFRMPHKNGTIRWFMVRGSRVRAEGTCARVVGTYTDITERKQADEALRQAQADLDHMSRLAAFGEFTASIAHELSQPLTAIMINTRACLHSIDGRPEDMAEVRGILSDVIESGKRADGIIRRNRELFRRHIVKKQQVNVNDVIDEVALLSGERLRANQVTLDKRLGTPLPPVLGDRIELCQLLMNLITNSIEAMQNVDRESRVVSITSDSTPKGEVQVAVRDAGLGLDGVNVERMFATGYTTKPTGTGMGLSICRTIVEAHGGHLRAMSHDGPGATFCFTIPAARAMQHDEPRRVRSGTAMHGLKPH